MLTYVDCECGNEVEVSDTRSAAQLRCPRCGRPVVLDDYQPHHFHDEEQHPGSSMGNDVIDPAQLDSDTAFVLDSKAPAEKQYDPEATIAHNINVANGGDTDFGTGMETGAMPKDDSSFDLDSHAGNAAADTPAAGQETAIVSGATPALPGLGSGVGAGTHSSVSKYDLKERVMHPISRPVVPSIPFSGPAEYEIHRVLRVHQRGGMGRILVAYDQYLKREVAIKELHRDVAEDDGIVRRFIGEAEITAQLEHPGIVPIHRLGQGTDGLPYYTMKMIKGETLQDAIKAYHRKPSRADLLGLVRRLVSVSKTIAFAHNKGVIHRDLKPANVMLGEHGETLVMDWGLAKPYGQILDETYISIIHRTTSQRPDLTQIGSIVGTPAFMSPEQANADENVVGPLSDVFSLGTVLYYLLAGQTAFSGRVTAEVLAKVRACKPTPPSQIKPNVPPELEAICLKAMEKLPENRYQGASEFSDDLCRWLDGEPVFAMKDTWLSKVWRWLSSHRSVPLMMVCVVVLSLFFSGIGVWLLERQRTGATDRELFPQQPIVVPVLDSEGDVESRSRGRR